MNKATTEQIMSASALITAVVAVWIAVVEQQSNREYQRSSVEPYLELANSNAKTYERFLTNSGLGPARIESVEVSVNDVEMTGWKDVVNVLTGDDDTPISYSGLWKGRQMKAGEQVTLVHLTEKETARMFHRNIQKLNMKICYCSIYKDCWIKENAKEPQPVSACPVNDNKSFPR